MKLGTTI